MFDFQNGNSTQNTLCSELNFITFYRNNTFNGFGVHIFRKLLQLKKKGQSKISHIISFSLSQVWHYCDLNGGQASFLCPNGTIFSQVALTCDWWFNVRCNNTAQLYVLNERLYKFILPTKPSFPEDYSGPEVDEYLTQKFYESESKRKPDNETEASVSPGTTTEPVQSNDLNDNYLRRRDVYQVQPVPADRRYLEVDGEVEYEDVDTEPRAPIDGLTSSSDRDEVFVDSQGQIIVSSDISINRRDVLRELPDITSVGRDSSPQLKEASANSADSSQLRDLTTQLRTWRWGHPSTSWCGTLAQN